MGRRALHLDLLVREDNYREGSQFGGFGPIIPWLNDEQAEQFLKLGLVERIEDPEPAADSASEAVVLRAGKPLLDCLQALEHLGVDIEAGAPTARTALRGSDLASPTPLLLTRSRRVRGAVRDRIEPVRALLSLLSGARPVLTITPG